MRRPRVGLLVSTVLLLAVTATGGAPSAGASQLAPHRAAAAPVPKVFTLRRGDFAAIKGTAIQCSRLNATRTTPSGLRCAFKDRRGDVPGSYSGVVLSDRSVVVSRADENRRPDIVYFSEGRKTSSRQASSTTSSAARKITSRTYLVGVGDILAAEGSPATCRVDRTKTIFVMCASRVDRRGPISGSKGFVVEAGGAVIATAWDSKRVAQLLYPLPGEVLTLQSTDTVVIEGTSINCVASSGAQAAMAVFCANTVNGSSNGSAVFVLSDKGQLAAGYADPQTGTAVPQYVRTLGVSRGAGQHFSAKVGSTLRFGDSAITCKSERPARGLVQLECFLAASNGKPVRLSYGARIGSDLKVEAGRYDKSGAFKAQYRRSHA